MGVEYFMQGEYKIVLNSLNCNSPDWDEQSVMILCFTNLNCVLGLTVIVTKEALVPLEGPVHVLNGGHIFIILKMMFLPFQDTADSPMIKTTH